MVTLFCAVVGVAGSAFPVDIDAGETVGDLKKAIAEDQKYDFAASKLQLFLAKTEGGAWLIDDDDLDKKMLQNEVDTSKMKRLRGSWKLNKSDLFGPDVALGEDVIHVLIVVPKIDSKRRTVAPAVESVAIPSTTALNKPDDL
nr:CRN effector protein [Phytophthora cinnamomi]